MSKLKITLVKSTIGRLPNQRATIEALGLRKISTSVIQENNDVTRGMVETVHHLVKVEEI